ncbi:MAG TPA: aminotransferase class V-fold PLP-dependent enzyme [Thermomicrobiales bacterium]|nr:aminotransferase class V-fold PLP-dependent enzyme [Thermomicrobiales bacterium]
MTSEAIQALFSPAPGTVYLDAATYGLPPRPTVEALELALRDWQTGRAEWMADWDRVGEDCRALFATLIGAEAATIALIPTVSVGVGLIAASLEPGDEILVPAEEFTSVLFPFLVAEQAKGAVVREVPLERLPDAITAETRLVAFSLTRSQDGETASLAEICRAAREKGGRVLVDATHAVPFVPVADHLAGIDYLICHGYKHLLCPRGVGFLYVRQDRWETMAPWFAGWRAGAPRYGRSFGGPLTLAQDAARFDVSLGWHAWVGAKASLELLAGWQRDGALAAVLDLSARLAGQLDLPSPVSSIVCFPTPNAKRAASALDAAGIRCAAREHFLRFSPHVYNTAEDIDRAATVLRDVVGRVAH